MRSIVLIAHNLRSAHNVGALLRTADGLGISSVILSGYTPYPRQSGDKRLPHEAAKVHARITKTALGAEATVHWTQTDDLAQTLNKLKADGYELIALEQADSATPLPAFKPPAKSLLIVGREVEGLEPEVLALADKIVEIPMRGRKESFNVASAAAMALYHFVYYNELTRAE